jgi:hypothetical protein
MLLCLLPQTAEIGTKKDVTDETRNTRWETTNLHTVEACKLRGKIPYGDLPVDGVRASTGLKWQRIWTNAIFTRTQCSRVRLGKLGNTQLLNKFPTFYPTKRFL